MTGDADAAQAVASIVRNDPFRWRLLQVVQDMGLPDCWVAAGFIRNAVWDYFHMRPPTPPSTDIDVIWFDQSRCTVEADRSIEAELRRNAPDFAWSVKNQARMHVRNGDAAYASATEAMRYWPETATAVAARRLSGEECEIAAPLGLEDLIKLILRPTAQFSGGKRHIFDERVSTKNWLATWPLLRLA